MKAVTFQGPHNVKVNEVQQPDLMNPDDAIVRVTHAGICGTDLHLYHALIPAPRGMTIGHEIMGIVEAVGPNVKQVHPGDRVVVGFPIACGHCVTCEQQLYSLGRAGRVSAGAVRECRAAQDP